MKSEMKIDTPADIQMDVQTATAAKIARAAEKPAPRNAKNIPPVTLEEDQWKVLSLLSPPAQMQLQGEDLHLWQQQRFRLMDIVSQAIRTSFAKEPGAEFPLDPALLTGIDASHKLALRTWLHHVWRKAGLVSAAVEGDGTDSAASSLKEVKS